MKNAMEWSNKSVLVTGAGGFIGSHLVEALLSRGARVRAFVRYTSRNDWGWLDTIPTNRRKELHIFRGDLQDSESVRKAMRECGIVFHLGALIGIPYSYVNPREYVAVNIVGTFNVLNAALDLGIERVVHTSTSEVYGTAQYVPMDEKHPLRAQSPYAATKIAADKLAESYWCSFGLPVTILRPFNTYGPRQSARAVIPTTITQALTANQIQLGSMSPVRDLTFVEDTVGGFIQAAECEAAVGEVINIGAGRGISIGELTAQIIDVIGRSVEIVRDPARVRPDQSEVQQLIADTSKARRLFGWQPRVSLKDGLHRTIEWFMQVMPQGAYKADLYNL
jgi:NAD dependent epimerase/dehydratase